MDYALIFQKLINEFFFYKSDNYFYTCLLKMLQDDYSITGDALYEKAREEIMVLMRLDWQDKKRNWFVTYVDALCLRTGNRHRDNRVVLAIMNRLYQYGLSDDWEAIQYLLERSTFFYDLISSYSKEYVCKIRDLNFRFFLSRCLSVQKCVKKREVTENNLYYFYQDIVLNDIKTNDFVAGLKKMYACKLAGDEEGYCYYRNSWVSTYIYKLKNCVLSRMNCAVSIDDLIQDAVLCCIQILDKYDGRNIESFYQSLSFRIFFIFSKQAKQQDYAFSYERMLDVIGKNPEREKEWFNIDAVETPEDYLVRTNALDVAHLIQNSSMTSLKKEAIVQYYGLGETEKVAKDMASDLDISRACVFEQIRLAKNGLQVAAFRQFRIDDNEPLSLCSLLQCTETEKQRLLYGMTSKNKMMFILQKMFDQDYSGISDFKKLKKEEYILYFESIDKLKQILQLIREYDHTSLQDILHCSLEEFHFVCRYLQSIRCCYNIMSFAHGESLTIPVDFDTLDLQRKCAYLKYLRELQDFLRGFRMSETDKEEYITKQCQKRVRKYNKKNKLKN